MKNEELNMKPELEIVLLGGADIVRTSVLEEDELPGVSLM